MNRRNLLKTVGSTVLLPSISIPDVNTEKNVRLAELFCSYNFRVVNTDMGQCRMADLVGDGNILTYQVYPFKRERKLSFAQDFKNDIAIRREYETENHYEAFTLFRIAENQGFEQLKSTIQCLEIRKEQVIKGHELVYEQ